MAARFVHMRESGWAQGPTPTGCLRKRTNTTFKQWSEVDIPELFYAAVAAEFAPGKPLVSVLDIGCSVFFEFLRYSIHAAWNYSVKGRPKGFL